MSHMKQYLLENRHWNTLNRKINVGVFNFDELRRIAGVTHRPLSSIIAMAEKLDTAENTIPALAESEMA